tara:strand:- start:369 stop:1202 length:834 start_codon:yes stop_codon:yes gene_type:complete
MRDYTKDKLTLADYHRYTSRELDSIFELTDNLKINKQFDDETGLKYVTVHDLFKRPDEVIDFLKDIPSEDRTKSIVEDRFTYMSSNAPGFQQPLESKLVAQLGDNIYNLGKDTGLHKYERSQCCLEYYTNTCYPGMKSCQTNWLPHVDPFSIACNMYLTQCDNTGTSFFRFVTTSGKKYYSTLQLGRSRQACEEFRSKYEDNRSDYTQGPQEGTQVSDWVYYLGDSEDEPLPKFERYAYIKADRNMLSMYRGNRWHGITYDADNEKDIRYSLVGVIK